MAKLSAVYKRQSRVERLWKISKDPSIMLNASYMKKPEKIEAANTAGDFFVIRPGQPLVPVLCLTCYRANLSGFLQLCTQGSKPVQALHTACSMKLHVCQHQVAWPPDSSPCRQFSRQRHCLSPAYFSALLSQTPKWRKIFAAPSHSLLSHVRQNQVNTEKPQVKKV